MEVQIHQGEAHHVGRDVVALEVLGETTLFIGGEREPAFGVSIGAEDVLIGGDEEARSAAGRVEDGLRLLRIEDRDDKINDVAWGAELTGIALRAEDGEEILEGGLESST